MHIIAHAHNGYTDKFGIPRQSGRVEAVETRIVFTPTFRSPDAIRGIDQWSHLWLLWGFSKAEHKEERLSSSVTDDKVTDDNSVHYALTVRPPRLGGNTRLGVFATRSPFRPNAIGLSSVRLLRVEDTPHEGQVLVVAGADLMDGTPIYDIKPYLPYTDAHPEATNGFAETKRDYQLEVIFPEEMQKDIPAALCAQLIAILADDPRPAYHDDPQRIYGLTFGGYNLHFRVIDNQLQVVDIAKI